MKKLLLLFISIFSICSIKAQTDSWKIMVNKKALLKANSDLAESSLIIKMPVLKSSDKIYIDYSTANTDNTWKRSFFIVDEKDNTIAQAELNKQSGSVCFGAAKFKKLMNQKQTTFVYTTSIPKDKGLAATVRVRRVLLSKIEWK